MTPDSPKHVVQQWAKLALLRVSSSIYAGVALMWHIYIAHTASPSSSHSILAKLKLCSHATLTPLPLDPLVPLPDSGGGGVAKGNHSVKISHPF